MKEDDPTVLKAEYSPSDGWRLTKIESSPEELTRVDEAEEKFTQQELPACKPILTPGLVITTLISIGIIFVPIGLGSLSASEHVVEIVDRYDDACIPSNGDDEAAKRERLSFIQNAKTNKTCIRNLVVPKKMKHPIHVYYQLDNFYQNHRRYVKSRSDRQYRSPGSEGDTKTCAPESEVDDHRPIVPCGLIAWSLFNDTYGISTKDNPILINKKDIAWPSDKNSKFGSNVYPKNFQKQDPVGGGKLNESLPLSEQEDLLVWMRTAALPNFRKLYGRIETDLEADEKITVVIQNNYNTYSFDSKKQLVLSTTTWIGGKNDFLGKAYISVGGTCLFLAIAFILTYVIKPRPLGDPAYLSWNLNSATR
ncbi:ALA-interacting subunit 5-like [Olea europaea subsp. europaea]|uniref:ALA-interacting subunit n=1 Tax=Olea europaea subsp. europaea TaxID=158383 RepID=A0A8S0RGS9_OLEEU|nr:ALA-interacting subunit 5-like [Olea europaea subsp. europaea]